MKHSLVIVEGVHDAAFIGHLLRASGFKAVEDIAKVPDIWRDLIPKIFPDGDKLQHVVSYPDIYISITKEKTKLLQSKWPATYRF